MKKKSLFFRKIPVDGVMREHLKMLLKILLLLEADVLLLYVLGVTWFAIIQVIVGFVLFVSLGVSLAFLTFRIREVLDYQRELEEKYGCSNEAEVWPTILVVRLCALVLFLIMLAVAIIGLRTAFSMQSVEKPVEKRFVSFVGIAEYEKGMAEDRKAEEGSSPIRIYWGHIFDNPDQKEPGPAIMYRVYRVMEEEEPITYTEFSKRKMVP